MNASPYNGGRPNGHGDGKDGGGFVSMPGTRAARPGQNGRGNGAAHDGEEAGSTVNYPPPGAVAVTGSSGVGQAGLPVPDEQLLADYRHGDKKAFADLVARYQRELYHFLVRFLGNRAAAEDVFQETFLQVHQSAEQFDLQRRFRPWLFTIAANKARDLIRSQARRPTNPLQASISGDDESGEFIDLMQAAAEIPGAALESEELQKQVQNTVGTMPEHLREILLLSYFHQFPYKQIGEILGIPLGTVKSRLHAAVAHFADRWKANPGRSTGVAS
jgi:RNA polymerase sigma-70 factor (ECF subfamily)